MEAEAFVWSASALDHGGGSSPGAPGAGPANHHKGKTARRREKPASAFMRFSGHTPLKEMIFSREPSSRTTSANQRFPSAMLTPW